MPLGQWKLLALSQWCHKHATRNIHASARQAAQLCGRQAKVSRPCPSQVWPMQECFRAGERQMQQEWNGGRERTALQVGWFHEGEGIRPCRSPFPGCVALIRVAQTCTCKIAGAGPSSPIGVAGACPTRQPKMRWIQQKACQSVCPNTR